MKKKVYFETDKNGKHKIIEQSNGIIIRLLKEPSKEYIKKKEKHEAVEADRLKKEKVIHDREKLIKDRMRDIAIAELEKEGKI